MPTDAATAMSQARENYRYLAVAQDKAHLLTLKNGASGYNQSLKRAGIINEEQLALLTDELESVCTTWHALRS